MTPQILEVTDRFRGRDCKSLKGVNRVRPLGFTKAPVLAREHALPAPASRSSPAPSALPPRIMRMGGGRSELGEAEHGLEQLAPSLSGGSVSLLPPNQDLKGTEDFEVRVALCDRADGPFSSMALEGV